MSFSATPEIEVGTYADFVGVWHLRDCFVLDFSTITQPPQVIEDAEGRRTIAMNARIVSRVKIPPSQVFEIMKALEAQLSAWERETGNRTPGPGDGQ